MPGREVKQLETENKLKTKAAGLGFAVNKARQASSKSERKRYLIKLVIKSKLLLERKKFFPKFCKQLVKHKRRKN